MLVFQRKLGEQFVIGEGENASVVTINEIRSGGTISVAIDAPKHIRVDRMEVHLQREAQARLFRNNSARSP